jgi:hypothetical protein
MLTFLPRSPWLAPGLLLMMLGLWLRSGTFWVNLATTLFVLVWIVGFNVPTQMLMTLGDSETSRATTTAQAQTVRVVSANTQHFQPDFALLLREIRSAKPDVIALQESSRPPQGLRDQYPDWHFVRIRSLCVGSRWPLKVIGQCNSDVYDRVTAIMVEVEAPFGRFLVTDLHLMTARRSLIYLHPKSVLAGTGQETVNEALIERSEEARQTREFVTEYSSHLRRLQHADVEQHLSKLLRRLCEFVRADFLGLRIHRTLPSDSLLANQRSVAADRPHLVEPTLASHRKSHRPTRRLRSPFDGRYITLDRSRSHFRKAH